MNVSTWRHLLACALFVPLACGTTDNGEGAPKDEDTASVADAPADAGPVDVAVAKPDTAKAVDLGPPNKPPVATDDLAATFSGNSIEITVLYNDSDPDGDKLKINETTQGKQGTVGILYGGTVLEYTPIDPGWVGIDTFTYTATDGKGGTDTANVAVNCKGLPTLKIVSPANNDVLTNETLKVVFEVTGCNFSHPSKDKNGCHVHKFLDGKGHKAPGSNGIGHYVMTPISITPVDAGPHTFGLQLFRNDGSDGPWSPSIEDGIKFEMK